MGEKLIFLGFAVIMLGILLVLIGSVLSVFKGRKTKTEGGFIFFVGPFPVIGGATSKEIFYVLLTVSVILIVLFLLLGRGLI